jgi:uncharacterized protein YbbK (DUF523 family)
MILISKCCVGVPCRYRHTGYARQITRELGMQDDLLAACPEQLGGLSTPREGCSVVHGRVVGRKSGRDYTEEYRSGAAAVLALCHRNQITRAFLLSNSPSCGIGYGITARLLAAHGVAVTPI